MEKLEPETLGPMEVKFRRFNVKGADQFDGGSACVREPFICEVCDGGFPYANSLVQCCEDGEIPRVNKDKVLCCKTMVTEVIKGTKDTFKNHMADVNAAQVTGS